MKDPSDTYRTLTLLLLFWCSFVNAEPDHHWQNYKEQHGKSYRSRKAEERARQRFHTNRAMVEEHNDRAADGHHSYNLTLNHLADRHPHPRLHRKLTGLLESRPPSSSFLLAGRNHSDIPEEVNWVKQGFRTPAWSQGECGSCYAFTMSSLVEGQVFKKEGNLTEMSQQQLVDCTVLFGNLGCDGGTFTATAKYLQKYGILPKEKYPLPYQARQTICRALRPREGYRIKQWGVVPYQDETALKAAVAKLGPLAVSVNASPYSFQLYHSGVYDDPACSDDSLNHAMLLVGYSKDHWILKNWWSDGWGERGYMRLKRGVNRCGIANYAVYVTLD